MSLEQALAENTKAYLANTVAVNALTELLKGQSINSPSLGEQPQPEVKPEIKIDTPPPQTVKQETNDAVNVPTLEETTKTLMDLAKQDRNSAVAILTQFKVKKASEIPEEERATFLQAVKERLQTTQE